MSFGTIRGRVGPVSWQLNYSGFSLAPTVLFAVVPACFAASFDQPSSSHTFTTITHTTTTSATTTTTAGLAGCGGVARCLNDTTCAQCISGINATAGFPHTIAGFFALDAAGNREYQISFFHALQSTAACSTQVTPPGLLHPAFQELQQTGCAEVYRMALFGCPEPEYACFVDDHCRHCVAMLIASTCGNLNKTSAIHSPACTATNPTLLQMLLVGQENCASSIPHCTMYKQQCASSPDCAPCLVTLDAGDGAGAARQCSGTSRAGLRVDYIVANCMSHEPVECDFWFQRCVDNAHCGACLSSIGNGNNAKVIATDLSSPACQKVLLDSTALHYFTAHTRCPGISACQGAVTDFFSNYADICLGCFNGSAPPGMTADCQQISVMVDLDIACEPCPASVHTINFVVFATATVGAASAAVCIAVAMTVLANGRDRVSMRDRIVVGLMVANAVYSTANVIPLNALRISVMDCGRLAMSFDAIRFGRAWWVCGKYGLVSFELFILGASIRALHHGTRAVPTVRVEVAMQVACCVVAALAFVVFYTLCAQINEAGYNADVEEESYLDAFNHASVNDDLDDDSPSASASSRFQRTRDDFDNLVRVMLVGGSIPTL